MRSPCVTRARQSVRGTHSLGELPQLGLDAAVAHAHARERRANVPCGPWRGKRAAWEGACRGICSPSLSHEGARRPLRPCSQPAPRSQHCAIPRGDPAVRAEGFGRFSVFAKTLRCAGPRPCPCRPCLPAAAAGVLVGRPVLETVQRAKPNPLQPW